jgi:hypothetical protein
MTWTQIAVCGEWMQTHFDAFGIYRHLSPQADLFGGRSDGKYIVRVGK